MAIVAMALAVFVIANDVTAMSVALPAIESDFNTDVSTVQWVVNGYALIFGVLIVTGGRLADMFGRRHVLFIGAAIFAVFSLLGGIAPNVETLIVSRALMGVGGALMWPAILGLVYAILPESRSGLAGGLILGTAGIGNAAGPVLGGFITQEFDWRFILLLNLPIALVACLVTWRTVHVSNPAQRSRVDYAGIATLSTGLIALLVALGQAPDEGWTSPVVLVLFAACALLVGGFFVVQRRAGDAALIPRDIRANRPFVSACVAVLAMSATFFASLLYLPQYLQKVLGYSALGAGAGLLPLMGVFALTSFSVSGLQRLFGMKAVLVGGASAIVAGTLLISRIDAGSDYSALVPGMVVLGLGIGLFYSSVTTAAVTAVDPSRSSLAGGIMYMCQIAGGSIGLGLTTTVFLTASNREIDAEAAQLGVDLTSGERASVRGVLAGTDSATDLVSQYSHDVGSALTEIVRASFASGMRWGFLLDAALAVIGLVVTVFFVGGAIRFGRRRRVA